MAIRSRELGVLFIQTPHTGSTAIGKLLREGFGGMRIPTAPESGAGGGDGTLTPHWPSSWRAATSARKTGHGSSPPPGCATLGITS